MRAHQLGLSKTSSNIIITRLDCMVWFCLIEGLLVEPAFLFRRALLICKQHGCLLPAMCFIGLLFVMLFKSHTDLQFIIIVKSSPIRICITGSTWLPVLMNSSIVYYAILALTYYSPMSIEIVYYHLPAGHEYCGFLYLKTSILPFFHCHA